MEEKMSTDLRRYISARYLSQELRRTVVRFPFATVFALLSIIVLISGLLSNSSINSFTWTLLAEISQIGFFLSVAAVTWSESLHRSKFYFQCGALAVAVLACISWHMAHATEFMYVCAASLAVVFFLPCIRGNTLRLSQSYTSAVLRNAIVTSIVSLCMFILVYIVMVTVKELFNIRIYDAFGVVSRILCIFLPNMLFLSGMPSVTDDTNVPGLSAKLAKNLLLIPALAYIAILYSYEIMIVVQWELPKSPIAWMVTGIVVVVLFIVFGMQGYIVDNDAKLSNVRLSRLVLRWLPALLLPLLALMSVSIAYRICQYGFTPSRLYAVTFNLWAYGAVFYLIFSREPRFSNLATVFSGVFLIVSVVPGFNFSSVSWAKVNKEKGIAEEDVVEEVVSYVEESKIEMHSKPLKIADISQSYTSIDRTVIAFTSEIGNAPVADVDFDGGISVALPIDSLSNLSDSVFSPLILPVKDSEDKALMLTDFSVRVECDTVNGVVDGYNCLRLKGIVLKK